ncbi:MAG: transcriptional regulator [Verrucomicrobia bacterium 12-59-8]|nr:MAG: transcriptional regulator [Verrucomicrobia bacterium 12-59-8]
MKNHLKVLRAGRDWTQEELGKRVDVSRQAINALETGKHIPSLDLAYRLSAAFEMPVEQIFESPYGAGAEAVVGKT